MAREPDENADLKLVEAVFAERGLNLAPFAKGEVRSGKTPDRRVMRGAELVAYVEVKSPRDDWLDGQLDRAAPGQIVGGLRNDPVFNRLARQVEKAAQQFDAVNSDRRLPNILVFVNHDEMSNPHDLIETLTGFFHASDGDRIATNRRVSEGAIRELKLRIDAYMWIDAKSGRVHGVVFSDSNPEHRKAICEMFGYDESKIER